MSSNKTDSSVENVGDLKKTRLGEHIDGYFGKVNETISNVVESALDHTQVVFGGWSKTGRVNLNSDHALHTTYRGADARKTFLELMSIGGPMSTTINTVVNIPLTNIEDNSSVDLPLYGGVYAIYGKTGSGKTEFSKYLMSTLVNKKIASDSEIQFLRFGEPEYPSIHDPALAIRVIEDFLSDSKKKLLLIDSFRTFFHMSTKVASVGKGGVNNALFSDLTSLSAAATEAEKTILIVINPLTLSKEDVETVRSNIESSTAGVIETISYGRLSVSQRFSPTGRDYKMYAYAEPSFGQDSSSKVKEVELPPIEDIAVDSWLKTFKIKK